LRIRLAIRSFLSTKTKVASVEQMEFGMPQIAPEKPLPGSDDGVVPCENIKVRRLYIA
jgi:hypothetical protein